MSESPQKPLDLAEISGFNSESHRTRERDLYSPARGSDQGWKT